MSDSIELPHLEVTESTLSSPSPWGDRVGIIASVGCAIHCAAMPLVIAWLPALGLSFLAEEGFHQWMAVLCFGIALAAFVPGWRLHRRLLPAAIGSAGLVLITGAAFGLEGDCCARCRDAHTVAAAPAIEAACTEECCAFSAAEQNAAEQNAAEANDAAAGKSDSAPIAMAGFAPAADSAFFSTLTPWLTPIGGLLLVSAHLLNRRFGFQCVCCETAHR